MIKPESKEALVEIEKLFQQNPTLKLYVVGHTDNVGGFEYNINLSQKRGKAVEAPPFARNYIKGDQVMGIRSLYRYLFLLGAVIFLVALGSLEASTAQKKSDEPPLGPYGPALGSQAHVVRSVIVKTTGDVSGEFSGTKGEKGTYLSGLCNPKTMANFMIALTGGDQWDEIWVTNYSKGRIAAAKTGTFKLSWVEVQFRKYAEGKFTIRKFKGPGTMTLTTHDADPDNRRMIGTMEGSSLEELTLMGKNTGKQVDLQVSFDMDSSCGIKE